MNKETVKSLIQLSSSIEEADQAVEAHIGSVPSTEKLAFLKNIFGDEYFREFKHLDSDDSDIYILWLTAIINAKF